MIKKARQDAGLTQEEFSKMFKIPIDTVKNWDSGRRNPPEWAEKLIIEKIKEYQDGNMNVTLTQEEISQIMIALTVAKIEAEESIKTAKSQDEKELRESTVKEWEDTRRKIGLKLGYYKESKETPKEEKTTDPIMELLKDLENNRE